MTCSETNVKPLFSPGLGGLLQQGGSIGGVGGGVGDLSVLKQQGKECGRQCAAACCWASWVEIRGVVWETTSCLGGVKAM